MIGIMKQSHFFGIIAFCSVQGTVDTLGYEEIPKWYVHPSGKPSVSDFEKLYGRKIKPFELEKPGAYTLLNTMNDMKENPVVQQIMNGMRDEMLKNCGGDENGSEFVFMINIVFGTPLIRLVQQSGGMTSLAMMQAAVACANGDMSAIGQLEAVMGNMG